MIRQEVSADAKAVHDLNAAVFDSDVEADLVDNLRNHGHLVASLVSESDGAITGHILLSRLITVDSPLQVAALGPMAVAPAHQRQGIGSSLIRAALPLCRELGVDVIAVLGHVEFYPRFGFSAQSGSRIESPYSGLGDAWMALELTQGALDGKRIQVIYPEPWGGL